MGKRLAYIRVSTVDQNLARQEQSIKPFSIDKVFKDKASAKDLHRPQLKALLEYAREGDTIYIHDFSRLARNTKDLLELVEELEAKSIKLVSIKDNIDTTSPMGKFTLTLLGAIAELERSNLRERQAEGIAIAKANGVYKGRKAIEVDKKFKELYKKYLSREIESKVRLAEELGISRPTLDKLITQYKEQWSKLQELQRLPKGNRYTPLLVKHLPKLTVVVWKLSFV